MSGLIFLLILKCQTYCCLRLKTAEFNPFILAFFFPWSKEVFTFFIIRYLLFFNVEINLKKIANPFFLHLCYNGDRQMNRWPFTVVRDTSGQISFYTMNVNLSFFLCWLSNLKPFDTCICTLVIGSPKTNPKRHVSL